MIIQQGTKKTNYDNIEISLNNHENYIGNKTSLLNFIEQTVGSVAGQPPGLGQRKNERKQNYENCRAYSCLHEKRIR